MHPVLPAVAVGVKLCLHPEIMTDPFLRILKFRNFLSLAINNHRNCKRLNINKFNARPDYRL